MKQKNIKKKPEIRKNIDLPDETVKVLDKLAKNARMPTKPFIEATLIQFASENNPVNFG